MFWRRERPPGDAGRREGEEKVQGEGEGRAPAAKPPFTGGFNFAVTGAPEKAGREPHPAPSVKNRRDVETAGGTISIRNYCPAEVLESMDIDEGIRMFSRNNPERQKKALVNVAALDGGNIIAGSLDGLLVSYIGMHHPSERERWGKPGYDWLFELGAIEVSRNFRELGLAEAMLDVAFDDPFYDDKIVLTTAFTWHWDLEATGMDKMQYRRLFIHLAEMYGFVELATDEPNVTMDSANLFLVRIGRDASFSRYQRFASMLFGNEWEAMLRGF